MFTLLCKRFFSHVNDYFFFAVLIVVFFLPVVLVFAAYMIIIANMMEVFSIFIQTTSVSQAFYLLLVQFESKSLDICVSVQAPECWLLPCLASAQPAGTALRGSQSWLIALLVSLSLIIKQSNVTAFSVINYNLACVTLILTNIILVLKPLLGHVLQTTSFLY